MLSAISRPNIQENIRKIALTAIFVFILSIPLASALMNVALALVLILYFLGGDYAKKINQIKSSPALILFLIFFSWTIFAGIYSQASPELTQYDLFKYKKVLLLPALIYFLNNRDLKIFIYTFLAATILMITYTYLFDQHGLIVSLQSKTFTYSANPLRNYITEGVFLSISLFATLWFIKNRIHTALMSCLLILVLVQMTFNMGRMALISSFFTLIIFVLFSIKNIKTKLILVIGVLLLAYGSYLTSPLIKGRVDYTIAEATQVKDISTTTSPRLMYWNMSLDKIKNNPILGLGPGSFRDMTSKSNIPSEFKEFHHSHNEYLFIWLQYGLIGLSLFISALYFSLRKFTLANTSPARVISYVAVLIMMLNFLTDAHFYNLVEGYNFILFLALYLSKDINDPITKGS